MSSGVVICGFTLVAAEASFVEANWIVNKEKIANRARIGHFMSNQTPTMLPWAIEIK